MDCICSSHHLYSESNESNTFHKKSPCTTNCSSKRTPLNSYPSFSSPYVDLYKSSIEISSITFPSEIQKIDFLEILDNPLFFQKEFISKNVPCLITNALDDWDALDLWSDMNYLSEKINKKITIDINPDGFADSIKNEYFTQPLQIQGTISEYNNIRENDKTMVPYIQMQNNNFNKEFIDVFPENEINQNLSSFFGKNFFSHSPIPDATNFWMGDERSVSSLHKDHYENIYCVINGEKHFTLIPPIFYPLFFEGKFRQGKWVLENEEWILDNHDEVNLLFFFYYIHFFIIII